MKTLKLFCLPYAGGSASVYNPWKDHLDRSIQLVPVELAGRGSRIKEPLNTSRKEAVDDIYQIIRSDIENHPYMIFGHSMGALMTFDLVHKIKVNNMPIPRHLFFSGASAPHLRDEKKKYHLMSPEEFEKEVRNLGGTPPEFFQHQELIDMFLPILKNDFKMAETNLPDNFDNPLDIDFTVFQGKEDDLTPAQQRDWSKHTSKSFEIKYFDGGHFFLHDEKEAMIKIINKWFQKKVGMSSSV